MKESSLEMKKDIRSFRLFSFIFYMSYAILAFRNVYLREELGLPGTEIGMINSIGKLVIFLTLPLWGLVADLKKAQKRLLQLALFGSMVIFSMVGLADQFITVALMFGLFYFFQGPIVPVTDSIILGALKEKGEEYGKIRLFGSIGYLLIVTFVGQIFYHYGIDKMFIIYGLVLFTTLIVSFSFPVNGKGFKTPKFKDLKFLFLNRAVIILFDFCISYSSNNSDSLDIFSGLF